MEIQFQQENLKEGDCFGHLAQKKDKRQAELSLHMQ
jgi:hypothetical protein